MSHKVGAAFACHACPHTQMYLTAAEHMEDLVLDFLELLLVLRRLYHELLPLSLQVRPLLGHRHSQQLVAESVERDHEVEQCDLDSRLGEVVRVAEGSGDVEPEERGIYY